MTGLLAKCRDMIGSLDKSTRKTLSYIHDLVDGLCFDRSDQFVLTQGVVGVDGLWKSNIDIKHVCCIIKQYTSWHYMGLHVAPVYSTQGGW